MNSESTQSWIDVYRQDMEQAWDIFKGSFDDLVRRVIQRLVDDYDEQMELYTYTLEQLKSQDYQKLTRYFDETREYSFETWIAVVVRNCCMDWFRKEKGRKRLLKCIQELPQLDQLIFKYIYQMGYSQQATFELLKVMHGREISVEEFSKRIDQIGQILQKKTRWKLKREWQQILPPVSLDSVEEGAHRHYRQDSSALPNPNPEEHLLQNSSARIFQEILQGLTDQDRLIIHLHFYKNLTLQEIARILRLKSIWQVHRRLRKALEYLQKKLKEKNIEISDLE